MRPLSIKRLFAILVVAFSASVAHDVVGCSDCQKTLDGWRSDSGCCCSCTHTGRGSSQAKIECRDGEDATCQCEEGKASASCKSRTTVVVRSTRFYQFVLKSSNMRTVGSHIQGADPAWQFVFARGFDGGTPISKHYVWNAGVDLEGALRDIAKDFGACAEVDYENRTIVFGPAGTCP